MLPGISPIYEQTQGLKYIGNINQLWERASEAKNAIALIVKEDAHLHALLFQQRWPRLREIAVVGPRVPLLSPPACRLQRD